MRYAIVDSERTEAQPGMRGICQCCGGQTIAKCGEHVVWHWAHKRKEDCDPWWETETEWHRTWKDRFPFDWQEVVHVDPKSGEKHIADVKTPSGLVIEMQNSPIHPKEMRSREEFYGNMVWVVNGDRKGAHGYSQNSDKFHFIDGLSSHPICHDPLSLQVEWFGRGKLLHNWSRASAIVYLDFGDGILWRLDSFEIDKTFVYEVPISASSNSSRQRELFSDNVVVGKEKKKKDIGVVTPIQVNDFVECSKIGAPIPCGFGLDDQSAVKSKLDFDTAGSQDSAGT